MALFIGIFRKSSAQQSTPINPPPPEPAPPVVAPPIPVTPAPPVVVTPAPPIVVPGIIHHFIQSKWWDNSYRVTQGYGCTDFSFEGHNPFHPECEYFHEGIDFALPCGTPVYAGSYCTVAMIDAPGYGPPGNSAVIQIHFKTHDIWIYHMHDYVVKPGQHLVPGQLIGHSGTRGYSTGCHLHFEVRPMNATYRHSVNPTAWLMSPEIA